MLDRNPNLKAERGYTHPKSYVRNDGSEVLHGVDWKRRKSELLVRCGGRCEQIVGSSLQQQVAQVLGGIDIGERCRSEAHDPHHKIRRSKRRDDRLENLEALCRLHHDLKDSRKPRWRKHEAA